MSHGWLSKVEKSLEEVKNDMQEFLLLQEKIINLNYNNYDEIRDFIIHEYVEQKLSPDMKQTFLHILSQSVNIKPQKFPLYKTLVLNIFSHPSAKNNVKMTKLQIQNCNWTHDYYELLINISDSPPDENDAKNNSKFLKYSQQSTDIGNQVHEALLDDNIDKFQELYSQNEIRDLKISINMMNINFAGDFLTLFEAAALYSASNIFNFLWIQQTEDENDQLHEQLFFCAIAGGNSEILIPLENFFLKRNNNLAKNDQVIYDEHCLNIALSFHNYDVVDYIHNNFKIPYNMDILLSCLEYNNIISFISIIQEIPYILKNVKTMKRLIITAFKVGELRLAKFLVEFCPDTIDLDALYDDSPNGDNPLHYAISYNCTDLIKYLVGSGKMSIYRRNKLGYSPKETARLYQSLDAAKYLDLLIPEETQAKEKPKKVIIVVD
ncbi:hypothetical protein TRFO_26277 [Tritrichomonas foetus]|uniref:Uncharacterized protein n=1 Tax=Tritrichomonas foetus TaxID=1144522 RepID=A0A1J4K3U2_9EUKA|nr:hypothetical protein TRFO_26277 [Tritrichomonas foetus]|eukprot:OHT05851.1 hypothetical protein TRFO_26277 [Tritrichomonas foetus]